MRRCRIKLPNRCCRLISRVTHCAFEGGQAANRECRAAMTRKTYCGNLLWQSGLTLLVLLVLRGFDGTGDIVVEFSDGVVAQKEVISSATKIAEGSPAHVLLVSCYQGWNGKGDKVKFREYLGVIPFTWKYTPPDKKKPCGELSISTVKATKRVGP